MDPDEKLVHKNVHLFRDALGLFETKFINDVLDVMVDISYKDASDLTDRFSYISWIIKDVNQLLRKDSRQ